MSKLIALTCKYCPEPSEREPNNHPLPALTAEDLSSFLLERVNAHDTRDGRWSLRGLTSRKTVDNGYLHSGSKINFKAVKILQRQSLPRLDGGCQGPCGIHNK